MRHSCGVISPQTPKPVGACRGGKAPLHACRIQIAGSGSALAQQQNFLEELMAAGRGVIGLLIGNRQAGSYFDISRRGLAGSFIALLIIVAIATYLPILTIKDHDSAVVALGQYGIFYALQLGCTVIVLRQIKRLDALNAYLVGDNWISFFVSLIVLALGAFGLGGDVFTTIVFGIVGLVLEVNLCRIILQLPPVQIALLIVAQAVGLLIAGGIILLLYPLPPDVAAQLSSLAQ